MSLYLKYRPSDFESLVWQDFIKQTLQNAIKSEKYVGAYLFTWPRGTGKTSSARILALAMNCTWVGKKPCFSCDICRAFQEGRLTDIIEIDAASNTWVDNIREIIERAQFLPNQTRYKVYIIDEVHMLSKWAFNALLKILEEPPNHVKFILATTEIQKVPDTILSRCQRYDFKNITDQDIKSRLLYVAEKESIKIDEDSLWYIANNAQWWLRNALNLFEQLIIWNEIRYSDIINNLWITQWEKIDIFIDKLREKDTSLIDDFEDIISSWKNLRLFLKDLIYKLREKIIQEVKAWKQIHELLDILSLLDETYTKTKQSFDEEITFLTGILKIISWKQVKDNFEPSKKQEEIKKDPPTITETKIQKKNKEESQISENEIFDIFGSQEQEKIKKVSPWSQSFDKEAFISQLKQAWMKGAILNTFRGAAFKLEGKTLFVQTASKFALWTLDIEKNLPTYKETLSQLWYSIEELSII